MNERINLQDLAALLAEKAGITKKDAEAFLREYFEVMNEELIKDGSLKIKDLGTFKLLQVEDRESIDVTTGERVLIPAHYKVAFTPDKKLAETVNEPFAFFETTEIEENSALDDLKLLSEEEAVEEFEPTLDEEEPVIQEKPVSEENKDILPPEEPQAPPLVTETPLLDPFVAAPPLLNSLLDPLVEEKSTISSTKISECRNCHYEKRYHAYRDQYYNARRKLRRSRIIIGVLSALLLIALGQIAYQIYIEKATPFRNIPLISSNKVEFPKDTVIPDVLKRLDDSLPLVETPLKKEIAPKTVPAKIPETPPQAKVSEAPTSPQKPEPLKQIVIAPGQRLTVIAQKEYGNKAFWIYIYLENKAIIYNPDVLPVGVKITIPPAEKYGINSNDPASVQKAKDEAMKYP